MNTAAGQITMRATATAQICASPTDRHLRSDVVCSEITMMSSGTVSRHGATVKPAAVSQSV